MPSVSVTSPVTNDEGPRTRVVRLERSGEQAPDGKQAILLPERTPLPVGQIFVLCLMRFAEPISFTVVSLSFTHLVP